jgi:spore coat polysaccharide biosynthesis predicted glycosyltransferase SpsG
MRQIALCEALRERGHLVTLCCPDAGPDIAARLTSKKISPHFLEADATHGAALDFLHATHAREPVDVVVLDDYRFDTPDERALRRAGMVVCSMSDLPTREYAAHMVVNPTPSRDEEPKYQLAAGASLLRGTKFACIRSEFARAPSRTSSPAKPRILASFGGADPQGLTAMFCRQLSCFPELPGEYRIILGPALSSARCAALQDAVHDPRQQFVCAPKSMADQIGWSDIVVSAAGSTVWEICSVGRAMMIATVTDNQEPIAATLRAHQAAVVLQGQEHEFDFIPPLKELLFSPPTVESLARAAHVLVDGRGADRVAEAIEQHVTTGVVHVSP